MSTEITGTQVNVGFDLPLQRNPPPSRIPDGDVFTYEHHRQFDGDPDESFALRGLSLNPLIDAAQPMFGLVIRMRRLTECEDVRSLYETIRDQIGTVSDEVRQHGYDSATLLAYRYALCTFIDEAVMLTPWGKTSEWSQRSLLSYHHNETWGGEKFFTVLSRMMMDPAKYRDVLEFKYLCLCLGFRGKYAQQNGHETTLNGIIAKLHRALRPLRGDAPERLTDAHANVKSQRYRLDRQWPVWSPWAIALVVLTGAYVLFAIKLNHATDLVLKSLNSVLAP